MARNPTIKDDNEDWMYGRDIAVFFYRRLVIHILLFVIYLFFKQETLLFLNLLN